MKSSLRCERQVVLTNEVDSFIAMARMQASEVFGVKSLAMMDVFRGSYQDNDVGESTPIAVEIGEFFPAAALAATIYSLEGPANKKFNNLLDNAARRITADKIRGSSRGAKKPTGGKIYDYRPNTLMSDIDMIEVELNKASGGLYAPITAVARSRKGLYRDEYDIYALVVDPFSSMGEVLKAQHDYLDGTLHKYVSVRNAEMQADAVIVKPHNIPFAKIPHISEKSALEYTSRLTRTVAKFGMDLTFHSPDWRHDTVYS